jgi:hypothetical protein
MILLLCLAVNTSTVLSLGLDLRPPMATQLDTSRLKDRVFRQRHSGPERMLQVIAAEILERHHRASAREIAHLLLDAAGLEMEP